MTNIETIIREARRLGQAKAEEIASKIRNGEMSWYPCGGAWVVGIKRNTKFGKVFAKMAALGRSYGIYGSRNASVRWDISGPETQSMELAKAASRVFCEHVNEALGLSLSVTEYWD